MTQSDAMTWEKVAIQIYDAFNDIDNGCSACKSSFLNNIPRELALALAKLSQSEDDKYWRFGLNDKGNFEDEK